MVVSGSVRKKLVVILALCALVFVVVAAPVISYVSYENLKDTANRQQARLVGAVRESASIAAFVKNKQIAQEVLLGLRRDDEISAAELVGQGHFSLLSKDQATSSKALSDQSLTSYPLYSPVDKKTRVGELRVWSNNRIISQRAIRHVIANIGWLAGLSFLLTLVSIIAANRLIGSPLRRLARQLSYLKPGTQNALRVPRHHHQDEIGLVAASLNQFLEITRQALDTERELRFQMEKMDRHYRSIFASTHVGIMILDENGTLLRNNPVLLERLVELTEADQARARHDDFFSLIFKKPDDAWSLVAQSRKSGEAASAELELKASRKKPCWVQCILTETRDEQNQVAIIEAVLYDVTSRVQETHNAKLMAEEDPLTGLKNRRGCAAFIEQRFSRFEHRQNLVLMLLDLDGFKPINDSYGHAVGDHILLSIAKRLHFSIRTSTDLAGRLGGDEFIVILEIGPINRQYVEKMARKLIECISSPISLDENRAVSVGVSIGIAFPADYPRFDVMLAAADKAMYRVKQSGKNNYAFAERSDETQRHEDPES